MRPKCPALSKDVHPAIMIVYNQRNRIKNGCTRSPYALQETLQGFSFVRKGGSHAYETKEAVPLPRLPEAD
jgi:hypothetical protein